MAELSAKQLVLEVQSFKGGVSFEVKKHAAPRAVITFALWEVLHIALHGVKSRGTLEQHSTSSFQSAPVQATNSKGISKSQQKHAKAHRLGL